MTDIKGVLNRLEHHKKQTLGHLTIYKGVMKLFSCYVLELSDNGNKVRVSRIPANTYQVEKRYSNKFGWHYHIKDVDGRTFILIHSGNFYTDIKGCVLVGNALSDINNDGLKDVVNSKDTLKQMFDLVENFELTINDM